MVTHKFRGPDGLVHTSHRDAVHGTAEGDDYWAVRFRCGRTWERFLKPGWSKSETYNNIRLVLPDDTVVTCIDCMCKT